MNAQLMEYDLIIVGFGMATHRLLQELARQRGAPQRILVLGEEPRHAYNRVLLPQLLEDSSTDIALPATAAALGDRLTILTQQPVSAILPKRREVQTAAGQRFFYRQLVLATGAAPLLPAFSEGNSAVQARLRPLRDVSDVQQIKALPAGSHLLIQGGGFIALETAAALSQRYRVTICHRGPYLMNRQLDPAAAALLHSALRQRGITVLLRTEITAADADAAELQLQLSTADGPAVVSADLCIAALGIQPRTALARAAGLVVNRGIVVTTQLKTSDPHIFAIGECCECAGETVALVAPVYQQAAVLAAGLSGEPARHYQAGVCGTQLKISGLAICSFGDIPALLQDPGLQSLVYQDPLLGDYRRLWLRHGRLAGAVLCGDTSLSPYCQQLLQDAAVLAGEPQSVQPELRDDLRNGLLHTDLLNDLLFRAA